MATARIVLACWGMLVTLFALRQVVDYLRNPPPEGYVSWPGLASFVVLTGGTAYRLLGTDTALWALIVFGVAYLLASISIARVYNLRRIAEVVPHR